MTSPAVPSGRPTAKGSGPFTLGVDIGGSHIKVSVLDSGGGLMAEEVRLPTPEPATPQDVVAIIAKLAAGLPAFDRISVGFPGVVKGGAVLTAPNLGTEYWAGFKLLSALKQRLRVPARMLNDAAVQGLGAVDGDGVGCILTLGTGVGCALFRDRRFLLHLELGQHIARRGKTYDEYLGQAALVARGKEKWNKRLAKCIGWATQLTSCDTLYLGGGNARKITVELPAHVKVVSNSAGITGGVRLWERDLDRLFAGVPAAQRTDEANE
ncbi:MAG TPA: ROK family protein [Hyphomicrobiaceae bacterium]|nr:ROK family protein [Hyphomicrobiaceae bacterium]